MPLEAVAPAEQARQRPFAAFVAMARVALHGYHQNLVSLTMTMGVPLLFMVVYAFNVRATGGEPSLAVGFAPGVPAAVQQRVEALHLRGLVIAPVQVGAAEALRTNQVRFYFDRDPQSGQTVISSAPFDRPIAQLLERAINSSAVPAADAIELRAQTPPRSASELAFVPAIIVMSMLNLGLFTAGAKLLQDRSSGALRLYRSLPMSLGVVIGAEFVTKLSLAVLQAAFFVGLAYLIYPIDTTLTTALAVIAVATLTSLPFFAAGYAMGAMLPSYSKGIHLFTATNLLMLFLGDIVAPTSSYEATRAVSFLMPTTHAVSLLRDAMLDVKPTYAMLTSIGYLTAFVLLCALVVRRGFSFSAKE